MADDLTKAGAADRTRINVNEKHEVDYWTKTLGISEQKLCDAVKAVGIMAADVRKHLGKG